MRTPTEPTMRSEFPMPVLAISIPDAARRLGISRASLYRLIEADATFPIIRQVGKRCKRIKLTELEAWLDATGSKDRWPK